LFDLRSQARHREARGPTQLGKAKREIALISTVLRQRELAASPAK
jgi:ribosomal protein L29